MTKNLDGWQFSNLPRRPREHANSDQGVRKFCELFADPWFLVREELTNDYGVDAVVEALVDTGRYPTNIRCHVQIKSSNKKPNVDGSYSYSVSSSNLNYLLNSPNSFYVFYSVREDRLYYRGAEEVIRHYRGKKNATVRFAKTLDSNSMKEIHHRMLDVSLSIRDLLLGPNRRRILNKDEFVYTTDDAGKILLMHNMIWENAFGEIPEGHEVYHINGDVYDNRRKNLALRATEDPFPIEEFQIEISNAQIYNVLSVILEGNSAHIVEDVPPPPQKIFANVVDSLINQGWSINQKSLRKLRNRMRKQLRMKL